MLMQYFELSIAGECGIAKGSSEINGTILINQARMISNTLNHVMIVMSSRESADAMPHMNRGFSNYTSHIADEKIFIDSYKRGHGILKAFLGIDAFLLYPIIATNGTENLRFLSREKDLDLRIEQLLGKANRMEKIVNRNVSLSEAFNDNSEFTLHSSLYGLTDREIDTMKSALFNGYYDWPRRIDLSAISKNNNSSKVTTLYHIRKAEKKILESIFRKNTSGQQVK